MAQAAWSRASRDRDSAQHGGLVELRKDGRVIASEKPRTLHGHTWPDSATPEPDLRDVVKALLTMLHTAEITSQDLADSLTKQGLPTTRASIDALRGSTQGKRRDVCNAEVITLAYAAIALFKEEEL